MENATYKVLLFGETGVGKSSFFVRYRDGRFVENLSGTFGLDKTTRTITYMDNDQKIEVDVRLLFQFLVPRYFRNVTLLHNQARRIGKFS